MEEADSGKPLGRIGLVAADELRIAGFIEILKRDDREVVLLDDPHTLETAGIALVAIDADAVEHLLELVGTFRRMRPTMRLLVLGGADDPGFIERALGAGARGVLAYEASEADLLMAVRVVLDGSVWAPRRILARMLDRLLTAARDASSGASGAGLDQSLIVHLTGKELGVLRLLIHGLSNLEIARELKVEPATVKAHLGRLMRKAGVRSRTALTVHALDHKWG